MASDPPHESVQVPVAWIGADEVPVFFANQFVVQVDRGECFLTIGQMVPPVIIPGTPEAMREQIENLAYVPVRPVARIAFIPGRLQELIDVLEITKTNHQRQREILGDPRNP